MITQTLYIIEVTSDRIEKFRSLKQAHARSAELLMASIPHSVLTEITEVRTSVLYNIDDDAINIYQQALDTKKGKKTPL